MLRFFNKAAAEQHRINKERQALAAELHQIYETRLRHAKREPEIRKAFDRLSLQDVNTMIATRFAGFQ